MNLDFYLTLTTTTRISAYFRLIQ